MLGFTSAHECPALYSVLRSREYLVPLIRRSIRNPEPFMDNSYLVPIGVILLYCIRIYQVLYLPTGTHTNCAQSSFECVFSTGIYLYSSVYKLVLSLHVRFKSGSQSSTVSSCTSMYLELFCTSSVYVQHVLIPYENQQISVGLHFDRLDWRSSTVFERRFCCPRQLAFPKIHNGSFEISRDIANAHREI